MEGEYDEEDGEEEDEEDEDGEGLEEDFDGLEDMRGQLDPDDVVFVSKLCCTFLSALSCIHPHISA